jgi:hypothetical protein
MRRFAFAAAALAATLASSAASAAFIVPDGATAPFESWSRGDIDSTYAEWDTFTRANSSQGVNSPDVGQSGVLGATLSQTTLDGGFAIITSGGNIYSFSGRTSFDVQLPGYGLGAGHNTRIVVQARTLGSTPALSSVGITYSDGGGSVTASPEYISQVEIAEGGFSGLISTFGWDLVGYNPSSVLFELTASSSSMSLANLAVDTYTQTTAFPAFPNVVPEPSVIALAGLAACVTVARGRRAELRGAASPPSR